MRGLHRRPLAANDLLSGKGAALPAGGVLALSAATAPMLVDDYLPLLPGYLLATVVGWACVAVLLRYRNKWRADNLLRLAAPSLFVILIILDI